MVQNVVNMLRVPEVIKRMSRGRVAFYQDIKDGLFTKPVKMGSWAVAWPEPEVNLLQRARIAGKTDDEIRTLVEKLHAKRTDAFDRASNALNREPAPSVPKAPSKQKDVR